MKFIAIVLALTFALTSFAAPAKKKPVAGKPVAGKPVARKTVSTKSSAARTSATSKTTVRKKSKKGASSLPAGPRQMVQQGPSPDRYKIIQQALVDKGYLKSEPTGVWDQSSADAMRQFQTEKNLPPTGKLTAASLIGLGVGGSTAESASSAPPANSPAAPPSLP